MTASAKPLQAVFPPPPFPPPPVSPLSFRRPGAQNADPRKEGSTATHPPKSPAPCARDPGLHTHTPCWPLCTLPLAPALACSPHCLGLRGLLSAALILPPQPWASAALGTGAGLLLGPVLLPVHLASQLGPCPTPTPRPGPLPPVPQTLQHTDPHPDHHMCATAAQTKACCCPGDGTRDDCLLRKGRPSWRRPYTNAPDKAALEGT